MPPSGIAGSAGPVVTPLVEVEASRQSRRPPFVASILLVRLWLRLWRHVSQCGRNFVDGGAVGGEVSLTTVVGGVVWRLRR